MIAILGLHQSSPRDKEDISFDINNDIEQYKKERMYFMIKLKWFKLRIEAILSTLQSSVPH